MLLVSIGLKSAEKNFATLNFATFNPFFFQIINCKIFLNVS